MRKKNLKKLMALGLSLVMAVGVTACGGSKETNQDSGTAADVSAESEGAGISEDSPYADKGFDLSKHENVVMYALGERPTEHYFRCAVFKLGRDGRQIFASFNSWGRSG